MKDHIISASASVRDALDAIDRLSGKALILFASDSDGRVCGALTGGDIRRALLRGVTLGDPVTQAMNANFLAITEDCDPYEAVAIGKKKRLKLVPITRDGHLIDILDLDTLQALLPLDVVLMAGGKGERLRPLTLETPKPLLEVAGRPIIDRNIELLETFGINHVFVTVNYLHEKIEDHFAARNATAARAKVECVLEPKRLGTLGSLALIPSFTHEDVLVMNSDLLTSIDFEKMLLHHKRTGAALTVGAVPYTVSVPYAIMRSEGSRVTGLEEKPTFNYFANGGVYIIRTELVELIPQGKFLDAPDFIEQLIAHGKRVELFPIEGRWIDIGNPDDYRAANKLLANEH